MFRRIFNAFSTLFDPASRTSVPQERRKAAQSGFRIKYQAFQELLASNTELLTVIAEMETRLAGRDIFGLSYVRSSAGRVMFHALRMVKSFERLSGRPQPVLAALLGAIRASLGARLDADKPDIALARYVMPHSQILKELVDDVGGKNANLGEMLNRIGLPVPAGFAVTTWAARIFFESTGLDAAAGSLLLDLDVEDQAALTRTSEEIQAMVLKAPLPPDLTRAMDSALDDLAAASGVPFQELRVAVRSSAVGEDGDLSFAGQYVSLLGVPPERLHHAYKCVLASLYTPRALAYRRLKGIPDEGQAMGVAVLPMVDPLASGVLYSRHPFEGSLDDVVIEGVWGLGAAVVDGRVTPDQFVVSRLPRAIVHQRTEAKAVRLAVNPEGGLREEPLPLEMIHMPCLSEEQVLTLSDYALRLEAHYGCAQDAEWAVDQEGRAVMLQTRPLARSEVRSTTRKAPDGALLLMEGGRTALPGASSGPVRRVEPGNLEGFPEGGVLLIAHSSPRYLPLLRRASAVVAEHGSVTGHMASLCREFGVPTLVGLPGVMERLPEGETVTVDAGSGRIYAGRVESLLQQERSEPLMLGTPVHTALRDVAALVSPLNLLDPKAPEFSPEGCRTVHDVMRYLHEKSYAEMFGISDLAAEHGGLSARLDASTGLDLHLIDLGGAVSDEARGLRKIKPEQIVSRPLSALLRGLVLTREQMAQPRPVHIGGLMSVMGRQMLAPPQASERFGDKSYAIASDKYLNFSSRVGYHYGVLDCYCGRTVNKNYITFSFKGGAADDAKRERRARAIGLILERLGFEVERSGDRVYGRFQKFEPEIIEERLREMGRLLQFTRQTDMLMVSEQSVSDMADCFFGGRCWFDPSAPATAGQKQGV